MSAPKPETGPVRLRAVRILRAPPAAPAHPTVAGLRWRGFATAYGLTLANPPTILFFAGLFASLAPLLGLSQAGVFTFGVFAGSLLWWLALTGVLAVTASKLSPAVLRWINRASGLALIGLALYALSGVTLSAPS